MFTSSFIGAATGIVINESFIESDRKIYGNEAEGLGRFVEIDTSTVYIWVS